MLQRIASLSEPEQNEVATALSPLLENDRQPTQHMLEFFTAVRLLAFHYYYFLLLCFISIVHAAKLMMMMMIMMMMISMALGLRQPETVYNMQ